MLLVFELDGVSKGGVHIIQAEQIEERDSLHKQTSPSMTSYKQAKHARAGSSGVMKPTNLFLLHEGDHPMCKLGYCVLAAAFRD